MKYVLVTGGVISGIGKGIIASSTGMVIKALGFRTTSIKIDPYLNVDCGTMSPYEHGEVYVLDDGGECDLDLGNYERFLGTRLTSENNITTGKIYKRVIERERAGGYLGKTVQVVPHITDTIMEWIERVARVPVDGSADEPEVCVIELGGTVGDIESMPFIEALRQFQFRVGMENFCCMHVSLLPVVGGDELKTKPTQHSVRELRASGLSPDLIMCRCSAPVGEDVKRKISLFCQLPPENVIGVTDARNVNHVPLNLHDQGVLSLVCKRLGLALPPAQEPPVDPMKSWRDIVAKQDSAEDAGRVVRIAVVGKYTGQQDAYLSVVKALQHSAIAQDRKLVISWVESSHLEQESANTDEGKEAWSALEAAWGILVPGGFGDRGTEGMFLAAKFAREKKVPYFGICLGMQIAVIEFARHVLEWDGANSTEFDPSTKYPVVVFMPDVDTKNMGGTLRLGRKKSVFRVPMESSIAARLYGTQEIEERHRHRYEVNVNFVPHMEKKGLRFVAQDVSRSRMEVIELDSAIHPFFVGCQYHPEFLSLPRKPAPLFYGFIEASLKNQH